MADHTSGATSADLRERSLVLLEFPRVREALADRAHLPLSRERALALQPVYDAELVRQLQQETVEGRLVLADTPNADLSLSKDPRPLLHRAAMQGVLAGDELVAVADALDLTRRAKNLGGLLTGKTPLLRNLARNIPDFRPLERELRSKLSPSGELLDDASSYLRQLRAESRDAYRRATRALEVILESDLASEVLQDRLFTVRGERLVLPVKADFRGRLPGIVQGVSDSGATLFVEPMSNVSLTNAWREASAAEQEECLRILRQLSLSVSRRTREINHALELSARIDLALAKARYAESYGGVSIDTSADYIHLVEARHPLLGPAAVPVSLSIAPPAAGLVITGPNTGGKTVALKTLGLMVLMHQSGLHLPCDQSTRLPLVDGVYADIGDQQSIEAAVSTFSSHISSIAAVLRHATPRSLVLLDELGTSTDPEEGSALARAIIAHLADRSVPTVVTTHHWAVAALAEETESLENASVELDPVTLEPTYRVTMGLPGRSYALAVAERIGLDPELIEAAKRYQDPEHRKAVALLASIQEERHHTRLQLQRAEEAERRSEELARELERRVEELAAAQAEAVEDVRRELQAEAKRVRARLKQAEASASWTVLGEGPPPPRIVEAAGEEVADVQRMLRSRVWGRAKAPPRRKSIAVGDVVEIGSMGFVGTVLTEPDEDQKIDVLVGSARIRMEISRLRRHSQPAEPAPPSTMISLRPANDGATSELDIRGMHVHESLERLDGYLDQSLAGGAARVTIVHGKGTGALRQGVWRHLAGHSAVAGFDFAPRERGGDGATEVELA